MDRLLKRYGIALALASVALERPGRLPRRLTSTASRWSTILVRFPLLSLVIVLIAASSSHRATAQTTPAAPWIVQELWAFKDGAPESPTALAQTADGYLWVGASAGLFRFDGTRFELFRAASGEPLQSTFVSALSAADDGLWVGYWFGGFSLHKERARPEFRRCDGHRDRIRPRQAGRCLGRQLESAREPAGYGALMARHGRTSASNGSFPHSRSRSWGSIVRATSGF